MRIVNAGQRVCTASSQVPSTSAEEDRRADNVKRIPSRIRYSESPASRNVGKGFTGSLDVLRSTATKEHQEYHLSPLKLATRSSLNK